MFKNQRIHRGWESNHQRLKEYQLGDNDRWRLRDWDNHPNDPGWENGTYSTCHAKFRTKVQSGDIVFDTVCPGNPTKTDPIIRSVFIVKDTSNGVLSFDEYMFLDGGPEDGVQAHMPRGHRPLDKAQVQDYLQQIEARDAYSRYSTGSKPESIPKELWKKMLERAGTNSICSSCISRKPRDNCGSDGGCD